MVDILDHVLFALWDSEEAVMTEPRDYPRIVLPPPGPNARALIERDDRVMSQNFRKDYPLVAARGRGAMVEDVDGNRYLDFAAGIAVAATGHCHPEVVAAIRAQSERFLHMCATDFFYENVVDAGRGPGAARARARARGACSSRTRAPRWWRPRSSWRACAPAGRRSWPSTAPSTAAPSGP